MTFTEIKRACCPRMDPPFGTRTVEQETDLYKSVVTKIEMFDADGAADEQRAGRILQGVRPGCYGHYKKVCPNIRVIMRASILINLQSAARFACFVVSRVHATDNDLLVILRQNARLHKAYQEAVVRRSVLAGDL